MTSVDYGEGWIEFRWPDPLYGEEGLEIDDTGFCSRMMPFYSGSGIENVDLQRDRVTFRFGESLAKNLRLEREVEITFSISDADFRQLRRALAAIDLIRDWDDADDAGI